MVELFSKIKKNKFFKKLKWLDPFTYVDLFVMPHIKKISDSFLLEDGINVFFALLFAILIYGALGIIFGTTSPLVIVYSESMEPVFYRGDVIFLTGHNENTYFGKEIFLDRYVSNIPVNNFIEPHYKNNQIDLLTFSNDKDVLIKEDGAIVVYNSFPHGLPIIHRSITEIIAGDGNFILTKGDNDITNPTFDQDCGEITLRGSQKNCITYYSIPKEEIVGSAFFRIPMIGCIKLWVVDDLFSLILTGKLPKDFKGIC